MERTENKDEKKTRDKKLTFIINLQETGKIKTLPCTISTRVSLCHDTAAVMFNV